MDTVGAHEAHCAASCCSTGKVGKLPAHQVVPALDLQTIHHTAQQASLNAGIHIACQTQQASTGPLKARQEGVML